MRYKTAPEDSTKAARDLGVEYLLEGSLRRSGDRIGVTAQLLDGRDRTNIWSETYERPAGDLLSIQRDVARATAEALAIRLLPEQETALARASTTNTEAYDAYLSGLREWNRGTKESFQAAAGMFERAASLDPSFALAHDGAARAYLSLADYRFLPIDEARRKAREQVDVALRLDETIPLSHGLSAELLDKSDPNAAGVDDAYRRAIALNPSDAWARRLYAMYLLGKERHAEAIDQIVEAVRLDPLSPGMHCYAAYVYFSAGKDPQSQQYVNRALALDPNSPFGLYVQGHLFADSGRLQDAIHAFERAVASSGRTPKYLFVLARTYIRAGKRDAALNLLEVLQKQAEAGYVPPEYLQRLRAELAR
jgi:Tfp pilus assembly protein PilF